MSVRPPVEKLKIWLTAANNICHFTYFTSPTFICVAESGKESKMHLLTGHESQ
jgi:hypothetical protein